MDLLSLEDLNKAAAEIKKTKKCSNPDILILERHVQIVATHSPNFFAKYFEQRLIIKALIISNRISLLWIMLNLLDFCSFLVLILTRVQLEDNGLAMSTEEFGKIIVIIKPVAITQFFEAICTNIFKHVFVVGSTKCGLLGPVST